MIELNKGNMVYAIVALIKVDVIKVENLGGFSDNLKEKVYFLLQR